MKTLYLCYFGLLEPLVQTQVLPYLRELHAGGIDIILLTFEPNLRRRWSPSSLAEQRSRLQAEGIQWVCLPYHKQPSALVTLFDIAAGAWTAARLIRREGIGVLHARSHVPMAMALLAQRLVRCRLVFDFRGFLADEYVAAGRWTKHSAVFRAVKWVERVGLRRADQIVVLTQRMRRWLIEQQLVRPDTIEVVPCCVDLSRFGNGLPAPRAPVSDRFEVVYAGSVTGLYLVEEMGRFFLALRRQKPDAFLRILTPESPTQACEVLERMGVSLSDCWIGAVRPEEIPDVLRRARLGLSFRRPSFAQIAASPTKIPEYLAVGVPVVCNAGVGDMDELLTRSRVGVVVRRLDDTAYADAAAEALALAEDPQVSARCLATAQEQFDLARIGGVRYRSLYERLSVQPRRRTRILFLVPYPRDCAPSQRLKFEQYYPEFERQGIEVVVSPFVSRALWRILYARGRLVQKTALTVMGYVRRVGDFFRVGRFDAVYLHLWAVPFGPPWFEEVVARRGVPLIYDIDDLIYLPRASRANAFITRFRKEDRIARIMKVARHVIVCTDYLRQFALRYNPTVTRISSTINTAAYLPRRHSLKTRSVTIGWSGSHSTAPYLQLIAPALRRLSQQFDIRLLVVGEPRFRMEGVRVEARLWRAERETTDLAEMDIGVYPLPHEEWVLGKSGLKALQYMGMGIPVVASAIGAACEFIADGENGFLASDLQAWEDRLARLIQDPALRARMGAAGRATVEQRFSVEVTAPVYLSVMKSVLGEPLSASRQGTASRRWNSQALEVALRR